MTSPRPNTTASERAVVLELAAVHGAAEAARRTGVAAATIRKWVQRASSEATAAVERVTPDAVLPPTGQRWARRRPFVADALGAAAEEAVTAMRAAIVRGDSRTAKDYAVAAAVCIDKVQLIAGLATARTEQHVAQVTYTVQRSPAEMQAQIGALRAELGMGGDGG